MREILSATLNGVVAKVVAVEATFTKGLPGFSIVGLGNSSIQESKDRVKSALLVNGYIFPPLKITINLSPSDLQKSGSHFDLPIALMIALQSVEYDLSSFFAFGELGLDGGLKDCSSIFPIILSLAKEGKIKNAIVPKESLSTLSLISGVSFFGSDNLFEIIEKIKDNTLIEDSIKREIDGEFLEIGDKKYYYDLNFESDFKDVKGQEIAKRAALISACGMHNVLFEGSPGCGKSMITKRVRDILPPMSEEEILAQCNLLLLDGKEASFKPKRAFRHPHHSSTKSSIFGGGSKEGKIGEVALAHNGVLFFDELPHFPKPILEALREPLEDRVLLISRVNSKIRYETDFLFIGAMNPCPCGNLLSRQKECRCSELEIVRYKNRLSDPFLDRIDLFVQMQEYSQEDSESRVDSRELYKTVLDVFSLSMKRQGCLNGKLKPNEIEQYCLFEDDASKILESAISKFALSLRAVDKIKRVSRTIADIEGRERIAKMDVLEALSFRKRER